MRKDAEPPSVDLPVHVGHPLVGTDSLPSEVTRVPAASGDHSDVTINPHAANVLRHRVVAELAVYRHELSTQSQSSILRLQALASFEEELVYEEIAGLES